MVTKEDWTPYRTVLLCASVFYLCYGAGIVKETYFESATILDIARLVMGKQSYEARPGYQIRLGPHSYSTLLLSMGVTVVLVVLIWIIAELRRLFDADPLGRNGSQGIPTGEDQPRGSEMGEQNPTAGNGAGDCNEEICSRRVSTKERIIAMCEDLATRMGRIEERIFPLTEIIQQIQQANSNPELGVDKSKNQGSRLRRYPLTIPSRPDDTSGFALDDNVLTGNPSQQEGS